MISSNPIQIAATCMTPSFLAATWCFIVYICYTSIIHSSFLGHLSCFHILAIVLSAAIEYVSLCAFLASHIVDAKQIIFSVSENSAFQ